MHVVEHVGIQKLNCDINIERKTSIISKQILQAFYIATDTFSWASIAFEL